MSLETLFTLKKGLSSGLATLMLEAGEPAFVIDTGKLYIGDKDGNRILINPDTVGEVGTAEKLAFSRLISIEGDATGSVDFDGSKDVTLALTLKNTGIGAGTYSKVTINDKGLVVGFETLSADDIPSLDKDKILGLGSAASRDLGILEGNIPVLDANGKLDTRTLPSIAITNTFITESEEEMLGLDVDTGDVAIRNDLCRSFILRGTDPSSIEDWVELKSPTDKVFSINGRTGDVVLTADDVGLGKVTNQSKEEMFTDPVFTGDAKSKTQDKEDDSDNIATTAFVKSQGYIKVITKIDGGSF